jgi:hypothetical protein
MTNINGHGGTNGADKPILSFHGRASVEYTGEQIRQLVAALEAPFDPRIIEWRVCNTSNFTGNLRGQLVAYADSRAYQDRLNALFTPAGWTRKYERQFSGEIQRDRDKKTTPKVFVTCELTIHGLGSNSSTGEAWADDDNSGTMAEAQSFKRAASCFGLGRYLYEVEKVWVDLDDRKRPVAVPSLPTWATPEGWSKGLRPEFGARKEFVVSKEHNNRGNPEQGKKKREPSRQDASRRNPPSEIVAGIEQMHKSLGSPLYRGILKRVAKIWNPADIVDPKTEKQVLEEMEEAKRLRQRFESVLQRIGEEDFQQSLRSLQLRSFHQIDSIELLARLVREMERSMSEPF